MPVVKWVNVLSLLSACCLSQGLFAKPQVITPLTDRGADVPTTAHSRVQLASFDYDSLFVDHAGALSKVPQLKRRLSLRLFDDIQLKVHAIRTTTREDGKVLWQGKVDDKPLSSVSLIASRHQLTGNIRTNGNVYQLRTRADGSLAIIDMRAKAQRGTDVAHPPQLRHAGASDTLGYNPELPNYSPNQQGFNLNNEVKVLVYYTDEALAAIPDLLDVIELEFADTNQAFANSEIDASVSIAAKLPIDEAILHGQYPLDPLYLRSGVFTRLNQLRNHYGADAVHLYTRDIEGACGVAYFSAYPSGYTSRRLAVGVTAAVCTGNLTTAHELGHNFGADHDRYVNDGGNANYNYGYSDLTRRFKTIMAYGDECADANKRCTSIRHFSNPNVNYNTAPTGIAASSPNAADNAKMLNFTAPSVANYYGVGAPTITSVTQGNAASMTLNWTAVTGADSYVVFRAEATIGSEGRALCHYPIIETGRVVAGLSYTDNEVNNNTTYCYAVAARRSDLLNGGYGPDSLIRTGFIGTGPAMPDIADLRLEGEAGLEQAIITLPDSSLDYSLWVEQYNGPGAPRVSLLPLGDSQYRIVLDDITLTNQTLSLGLKGSNVSGAASTTLINLQLHGFDNRVPVVSGLAGLTVDQNGSTSHTFSIIDDQPISDEAVYAYSSDEGVIKNSDISITPMGDGDFQLHLSHSARRLNGAELIVGYSDGQESVQARVDIAINRTQFTPTHTQEVTWYVPQSGGVTRLLPFYDADYDERLQVDIVDGPSAGSLTFIGEDKVSYQANGSPGNDSFSFTVTGEDGVSTPVTRVSLRPASPLMIATSAKLRLDEQSAALVTHNGDLWVWGDNTNGKLGLGQSQNQLQRAHLPTQTNLTRVVDVAWHAHTLFALTARGELYYAGYNNDTGSSSSRFMRLGQDSDWTSVTSHANGRTLLLTKADGSVWGASSDRSLALTERQDVVSSSDYLNQIIPLYGVIELASNGEVNLARLGDGSLYSWGDNRLAMLGRPESSGYLARLYGPGVEHFVLSPYRGFLLDNDTLLAWGMAGNGLFLDIEDDLIQPTIISNEGWQQLAHQGNHALAIRTDGSLWSWGGDINDADGSPAENLPLGRGAHASPALARVGSAVNWEAVWTSALVSATLNSQGELFVVGGQQDGLHAPLGLGPDISRSDALVRLSTITPAMLGYADSDGDGTADRLDTDDDGDGVADIVDAFPLDGTETQDLDGDGIGDNADNDDDGDGTSDSEDAFPRDPNEQIDTDGDGIGNNADDDDDNDGVKDSDDAFPLDPNRSVAQPSQPSPPASSGGGGSMAWSLLIVLLGLRLAKRPLSLLQG